MVGREADEGDNVVMAETLAGGHAQVKDLGPWMTGS
jgi:hypothetical protein